MALTLNERLLRSAIDHAVDLQQYANGVVRKIVGFLNSVDSDLVRQLAAAMDRLPLESFTVQRLDSLLESSRRLSILASEEASLALSDELKDFIAFESEYQSRNLYRTLPRVIASAGMNRINVEQVYTVVTSSPLQGRLLREWGQDIGQRRFERVRDAIRIGYAQQLPAEDIVRRIKGTKAAKYSDGILETSRREIETITRTAIAHSASVTRQRLFESNKDLIKRVRWTATLDSRTTPICRLRDGKEYVADKNGVYKPFGHSYPWLGGPGNAHWGCRSISTPVLKSWRELGIDLDEMEPGERASMDGMVPADLTYGQWLKEQSAARQDEILGPTRGRLLRSGKLEFEQFANRKGDWLTLAQLRRRYPDLF